VSLVAALSRTAVATLFVFASASAGTAQPAAPSAPPDDPQAGHVHEPEGGAQQGTQAPATASQELPPFIPRPTDDDRRAAFPDVEAHHAAHDRAINYFVLVDQFEWQSGRDTDKPLADLDVTGWVGRDRDRFWFRAEGTAADASVGEAEMHALYGRQFSRWWDVIAGLRQDVEPGPAQTWAAFGVQGLAPYWFEVEATSYVSTDGNVQARFQADYDLRLTNRWIVQPLARVDLAATADAERHVSAGVTSTEFGFRLRYLVKREIAPYVGVTWPRLYGDGAAHALATGATTSGARIVAGMRLWR
jgi:copper resistance protein B